MKNADDIERAVRLIRVETTPGADERILAAAKAGLEKKDKRTVLYWPRLLIRRTIMRNRWTKLTTVAAAALMMAVVANLWQGPAGRAYALEETLDALREVKSFHIRYMTILATDLEENPDAAWDLRWELWAECDDQGRAEKIRVEKMDRGQRVVYLWEKGVKTTYWPDVNQAEKKIDAAFAQKWAWKEWHPRWAINELYEKSREGFWDNEVPDPASVPDNRRGAVYDIEVRYPAVRGEQIVIVRTNAEEFRRDDRTSEAFYRIDPESKRIMGIEERTWLDYLGKENAYSKTVYLDYDEDFSDGMFRLPEGPRVLVTDLTAGTGMAQGDMTDTEAAREVARRYLEALIDRDYAKAALLYGEAKMAERFREFYEEEQGSYFSRVEWMGEPEPHRHELSLRQYTIKVTYVMKTHDGREIVVGPPADPNAKVGRRIHEQIFVDAFEKDGKVYWIARL